MDFEYSAKTQELSENLLDFMDANLSKDGRVVVGYADGCIGACALPSGTAVRPDRIVRHVGELLVAGL